VEKEMSSISTIPTFASRTVAAIHPRNEQDEKGALLERILANPKLPSPPTLALQIVQKTRQPDCKVGEIAELLALDPVVCGKVLKTLNSALYSLSQPVTSLNRAVTILGLRPLRSLVLGLTLPAMQSGLDMDEGLRRYWKDSVAGAILTRELARKLRYPAPEDDLVASLLSDLGILLLRHTFRDTYQPWLGVAGLDGDQSEWEERNLGVHHGEVSAALLGNWGLPREIVEPIRVHHCPDLLDDRTEVLVRRAYLLDFTSRLAQLDELSADASRLQAILDLARDRYKLGRADLEALLEGARPNIEEFAAILKVDIGTCPGFAEALAAGCEELIRLSMESVHEPAGLQNGSSSQGLLRRDSNSDTSSAIAFRMSAADLSQDFFVKLRREQTKAQIQHYEVEDWIGQGGMGIVIKAYEPGLDRHVALKFLAPELATSKTARQRFSLEARFAAAVRSDHVVTTFAVSELDAVPFLVMEYIKGKSLEQRIDARQTFTVSDIARIAHQTALGLAAAHDLRLIHRDVKPGNILLEDGTDRVRIMDFGLARAMDQDFQLSQAGQMIGTPLFMSPEQVDGKPLTPVSDLFSLGSVLYTLCTGRLPFVGDTLSRLLHAVAVETPVPIQDLNPSIPDWLAELVDKLHAKSPADRFPTALAVAECCKPWLK
jgi:HD-like signal output (HDOD) protein